MEFAVIMMHRPYKGLFQKLGIVIAILQMGKWKQRAVKFCFESIRAGNGTSPTLLLSATLPAWKNKPSYIWI